MLNAKPPLIFKSIILLSEYFKEFNLINSIHLHYVLQCGTFSKKQGSAMIQLSVNKFRSNLKSFVEQSINDHIPIRVRRRAGRDFIVMSAEDWEREQETLYVLQNSSLMAQINESLKTHNSDTGYKPTKEELDEINSI